MTDAVKDTRDTKLGWLTFLENVGMNLLRLRKECPTICKQETAQSLRFGIDSTSMAAEKVAVLESRLMAGWGIKRKELYKWMDLGPGDLKKHMSWRIYLDSHSLSLRHGRTRKSRRS